jgi:hypothetical protein
MLMSNTTSVARVVERVMRDSIAVRDEGDFYFLFFIIDVLSIVSLCVAWHVIFLRAALHVIFLCAAMHVVFRVALPIIAIRETAS